MPLIPIVLGLSIILIKVATLSVIALWFIGDRYWDRQTNRNSKAENFRDLGVVSAPPLLAWRDITTLGVCRWDQIRNNIQFSRSHHNPPNRPPRATRLASKQNNMTSDSAFQTIPILSLALARDPKTKPQFLKDLRDTLLNVGFLYLSDTGLPQDLVKKVCELTVDFFNEDILSLEEKERIEMKNEKSFLGWSRVSSFCLFSFHLFIHLCEVSGGDWCMLSFTLIFLEWLFWLSCSFPSGCPSCQTCGIQESIRTVGERWEASCETDNKLLY